MGVITEDKVLERGRGELVDGTAVFEALPAYTDRGVDADEEEERSSKECVNYLVVPYVRGYPSFPPSQGDEFEQSVDVGEGVLDGRRG